MKNLLIGTALLCLLSTQSNAATCPDKVDLNKLKGLLEDVVSDADLGKEHILFNKIIIGSDRLCARKLKKAHDDKENLTPLEEEVAELQDLIESGV